MVEIGGIGKAWNAFRMFQTCCVILLDFDFMDLDGLGWVHLVSHTMTRVDYIECDFWMSWQMLNPWESCGLEVWACLGRPGMTLLSHTNQ